ncbi:nuclear transport factor 2 family protein [Trujillonella humicola]|uniref:nuclear transport factor 2 family protein n=1 Tax=Trujillonella humicola TaxID=3383699 RepID=UPI003906C401
MRTDRDAVLDLLARFAHGIDGRDWELYRSVFTDEIDVDYTSYRPGSRARMPADEWVGRARRLFPGLDATQHVLVNPWLQADGGDVRVRTSMRADHFLGGERYSLGGTYEHGVVRDGEDWRIAAVTLTVTWTEGDRELLVRGAERAGGR